MSNSNLELEIEKFYNKEPMEGIQKDPILVNGINGYPLAFLMNHGEIIRIEFEYESKNSKVQKSSLDACKLKITGSIVTVLNNNPFYMHLLRRWSKQKISMLDNQSYSANDEFYKKVTINCYGIKNNQKEIVRKIIFYNAYLCKYTEYIGKNSSEAFFELIVKQKADYRTSIKILPYQTKPLLTENIFDTKEMLSDYQNVKQSDSILQEKRYVTLNSELDLNSLSIHQIPAIDSPTIGELLKGQEVIITKNYRVDADGYNWVYVTSNGKSGWIPSNYLTPVAPKVVNNTIQQTPIVSNQNWANLWEEGISKTYQKYYDNNKVLLSEIIQINSDGRFNYEIENFNKIYNDNKEMYQKISQSTGVPPKLVAALHYRESTGNFNTYLHNGEKLGKPTRIEPKDVLFYDFYEAAVDALISEQKKKNIYLTPNSDIVMQMTFAEVYNGIGYTKYHNVASPYVYSGTNVYKKGKYVSDGSFEGNVVDKQPGVYILVMSE